MVSVTIQSYKVIKKITTMCIFAQIPTPKKLINKISLKSNQSIIRDISKPSIDINSLFSIISPVHKIKSALMICLTIATIRANHVEEALIDITMNCTSK